MTMIKPITRNKNRIASLSISAFLALSLTIAVIGTTAQSAQASSPIRDGRHDWLTGIDPNFDITRFSLDSSGRPFLDVSGTAGKTVTHSTNVMYAYVFHTNIGIYVVTSRLAAGDTNPNWQTYKMASSATDGSGCVTLDPSGAYKIHAKRVTLGGTTASQVAWVETVQIEIINGTNCITSVFDKAP